MRAIHAVPVLRARGMSARDGPLACSAASRLSPEKSLSLLGVERSLVVMRAGDVVPVLCARGCADDAVPVLRARGMLARDGPLACSAASRLSLKKSLSLLGVERSLVAMRAGDVVPVLCARGCADDADPALCARGLSTRDGPLACSRLSTWLAPTCATQCASKRHPLLGVPDVFLLLIVAVFDAQVGAPVGLVCIDGRPLASDVLRSGLSRHASATLSSSRAMRSRSVRVVASCSALATRSCSACSSCKAFT